MSLLNIPRKPNYTETMKEIKKIIIAKAVEEKQPLDHVADDIMSLIYDWMYEEEDNA